MKNKLILLVLISFSATALYAAPTVDVDREAHVALEYLLDEVALDPMLTEEEQQEKVQEFQIFAAELSQEAAPLLIHLLLEETHSFVTNLLQRAAFDDLEIKTRLSDYENAVLRVQNMTVEIARQMLFFVAELNIHRQYVYEFGMALGCPETQLLRHDLSKLGTEQFEAYARFFRGGRQEIDKQAFLAAWRIHQYEEHHLEHYEKEGCSPVEVPDERLRNNMRETVADLLAAMKQRGGSTMIEWLVTALPRKKLHPRLLPFLKEALIEAHTLYLESEENPGFESIKGFPCWNDEVEAVFRKLEISHMEKTI